MERNQTIAPAILENQPMMATTSWYESSGAAKEIADMG